MNCRAGARRFQGFGVPDFSFETASFDFPILDECNGGLENPPTCGRY
jgi:hypothetical protein